MTVGARIASGLDALDFARKRAACDGLCWRAMENDDGAVRACVCVCLVSPKGSRCGICRYLLPIVRESRVSLPLALGEKAISRGESLSSRLGGRASPIFLLTARTRFRDSR